MFPYLPATPEDEKIILDRLGLRCADEVFGDIPESIRLKRDLDLEGPKSELEVERILRNLSDQNLDAGKAVMFLGAGAYDRTVCNRQIGVLYGLYALSAGNQSGDSSGHI